MKTGIKYFVTAIGTDVGKTMVSTILVNTLKADYWKPIQCGNLEDSDSLFIKKYTQAHVFPERYALKLPASPHHAAKSENISISLDDFVLPSTVNNLIVEGAGGMMVPMNNNNELVIDIASKLNLELIVVSSFYLGSINHTLLSLEYAKRNHLKIAMLIFSGDVNESSLQVIHEFFPEIKIGFIPKLEKIDEASINAASHIFTQKYLNELV